MRVSLGRCWAISDGRGSCQYSIYWELSNPQVKQIGRELTPCQLAVWPTVYDVIDIMSMCVFLSEKQNQVN